MQLVRRGNRAHTLHLHTGGVLAEEEEAVAEAAAAATAEVEPELWAPPFVVAGRRTSDGDRSSVTVKVADSAEGGSSFFFFFCDGFWE